MARRKVRDPELTLFPFLSVLAAVMGTLILIIAGMSQIALANPKQQVEVQPFDPQKKNPVYVECNKNGVRIHGDRPTKGRSVYVPIRDMSAGDSPWTALLQQLEHRDDRYLMLLVRSEGVGSYNAVRASLTGTGIELGYEPLFGDGDVRFRESKP